MELTVVRLADQRRMVVAVEAADEGEALATICRAMGPAEVVREPRGPARGAPIRRSDPARRRARAATAF